ELTIPIAVLVSEASSAGSPPQITVDPEDSPLTITATLGQADSFTDTVRLGSTGGAISNFTFLPSRLRREDGQVTLGPPNVQMPGDPTIPAGPPADHQITISSVTRAGVYHGQFALICADCPDAKPVVVPLTLDVRAAATLTPVKGSEQLQMRIANCSSWDCW